MLVLFYQIDNPYTETGLQVRNTRDPYFTILS